MVVWTSPDLETHHDVTGIKRQCGIGIKINKELMRIEVSTQNGATLKQLFDFSRHQNHPKGKLFSVNGAGTMRYPHGVQ